MCGPAAADAQTFSSPATTRRAQCRGPRRQVLGDHQPGGAGRTADTRARL